MKKLKPQFLIIGLVAIITIISLIYFIFLKYSPIMNFKYEGYAVSGKKITEKLLGAYSDKEKGNTQNVDSSDNDVKNIDLAKIEEQGTIFKKLGQYFIGSKEKTEIDLNYPIYINDKNTIYNLSQDITLISKDFEKIAWYPNISITDGKIYNGNSLERADSKEYIFARTNEGIYINLKEIKINTTANEYIVPINSLIAFEENEIKYYSVRNSILVFNEIKDIDYNSQVVIKNIDIGVQNAQSNVKKVDNTYNYEELLTRLGIIGNASDKPVNEEIQKEDTSENKPEKDDHDKEDKKENETNAEEDENHQQSQQQEQENNETSNQENKYIKPEVTAEEFTAEVYSAKSTLTIKDPTARIIESPTFEIYKEGKIYLRRTYTQSGEIIVTGLDADTEYEIIGKYIYKNEEDKKIENTFFKGKIKTKGYESLGIIKLNKENGEIYNNKIQIKNVKITSDLHNEVIKGIDTVELKTGSIKTVLKNNKVNELLAGKEITIESSEGLKSNENIDYELKFYDKKGKELKVENNKEKTRTSKQEPKVTIKIKEQDIVSVTLGLKLSNKDNVKLENYKYIVRKPNGEIEKEERLSQNQKEIKLDDLDSNQYYSLKIYADYDLNNNKGVQKELEIGDLVFATQPLSTLGSVELKVEGKDITTEKVTLTYEIDEERTDKRLIQILNSIKVELLNTKTNKVVKTTTIQEEELQTLKSGQKLEKTYENLVSNTTYELKITSKVKPGTKEENAPVTYNYQSFTTVKSSAKVEIQNKFVTKDLIDLDVRIDDKDNAILNNKVRMELRDEKNTLVETSEVRTNKDWLRKTYNKLEENKTYTLKFFADEYNEGHTDATYKRNYLLKEIDILTEEGITGKIDLKSMLKKTTGKNLVDPDSKIKWYTKFVGDGRSQKRTYNKENNELTLYIGAGNQAYVYDLREYIGKEVTISFKIKADEVKRVCVQNNKKVSNTLTNIEGTSKDTYKEYKQTLKIYDGYVGIWAEGKNSQANVYIKDLQIELGNTKTNYEEYKYNMESKVLINLEDKRDEIITNDYYIKIYEDGKLVDTKRYDDFPENNKIENVEKELNIKEGHNYKLELAVKIRLRDYVLSTFEFNTKNGEILGISNVEEYKDIQPEGNYIVLNDLDFRGEKNAAGLRTSSNVHFQGTINFNGHTVYRRYTNGSNYELFSYIGTQGRIENLVFKVYLTNSLPTTGVNLCYENNGVISNITISVEESKKNINETITLLCVRNRGTIENFIINYKERLYAKYVYSVTTNYGNIQNGYIYGEDIIIQNENNNNAILVNDNIGTIEQVYILVNAQAEKDKDNAQYSKIARNNVGTVKYVYSVGLGNIYNKSQGPNVLYHSKKTENSYYIDEQIFVGKWDKKITNKALWDTSFQNNILNSTNMWEVDELVGLGYYPWLKLNDCMPRQDYIELPEMTDADLPEILFAETLESTNKTAKVKISMYNPSGEEVTNITVKNLECTIESQEYKDGRSEIIVNLSNPFQCVSSYSILSFTTKGAFNLEYTKEYEEGEILINVDLYNEIYTVEDWYEIKKMNKENYKLMANLDFKNADPNLYTGIWLYGILDGQGHTIQNIYIESQPGVPLFSNLQRDSMVLNLNIKNYNIESRASGAGIVEGGTLFTMKNVNIDTVNIISKDKNTANIGGIIGNSNNGKIENITMNNINIVGKDIESLAFGGIAGRGTVELNNIYVNNLQAKLTNINKSEGIGGFVGSYSGNKIKDSIVSGRIETDTGYVGGMIGKGHNSIENAISKVDIVADGDFVGGIAGNNNSDTDLKNNIYIGNIINKKDNSYVSAISGSQRNGTNNYIYEKNQINGIKITDYNKKLTKEQLSKENTYTQILNFSDSYNYEDLNNKLPLLNKVDPKELLPNQNPIYIDDEDISIKNVSTLREDGNRLKLRIEIANPQNLEIVEVKIENMDLELEDKRIANGITYIDLVGIPNKYYDNYQITGITYIKNEEQITQNTYYLIEEAFYKEINKFEDWQNIDKESYENYRLLTDLDFTGKQNINYNVKIGKLITEGKIHSIKNITLNVGNESNFGLIKVLKNGMENIKFENININGKNTNTIANIGIISNNKGNLKNIEFKNININMPLDKATYVGCIGISSAMEISGININNINISGTICIGGLIGNAEYYKINNILANDVTINGGQTVGGIIGNIQPIDITEGRGLENMQIVDSRVKGNVYVGGIIGGNAAYKANNIRVDNCEITGEKYVGGYAGTTTHGEMKENININNSNIKGISYVGGVMGIGGNIRQVNVNNSTIEGIATNSTRTGGLLGEQGGNVTFSSVSNSKIISKGSEVGALVGKGSWIQGNFAYNNVVEGYSNVGGVVGILTNSNISNTYNNSIVRATEHTAGGVLGFLENGLMNNITNISIIESNYYVGDSVTAKTNVGGIVGEIEKELYTDGGKRYYSNYVETNLISEDINAVSLGIGNMPKENGKIVDTYYYKYSTINGIYPNEKNEPYIANESYLLSEDLKQIDTYTKKLKWSNNYYNYEILEKNKYPLIKYNAGILEGQEGIDLPIDPITDDSGETVGDGRLDQKQNLNEELQYTFNYNGKIIKTYKTYSEIIAEDGSKVVRKDVRLYVKNGKLYALPVMVDFGDSVIKLVENNFIIDSYNGKEYEAVLGEDGRLYDLKEPINYPENFVNNGIKRIGNNLDLEDFAESLSGNDKNEISIGKFSQKESKNEHEVEVVYKNGDKLKFNYQTGEIVSFSKVKEDNSNSKLEIYSDENTYANTSKNIFEYIKEKFSQIGNYTNADKFKVEMQNKYEETIKLENKLEETPVEEAIRKHKDTVRKTDIEVEESNNNTNSNSGEKGKVEDNNETNNSLKETKYISMYSADKDDYQIYQEEELLDTSKQEVISENEKIEANNLNKYYASEGKVTNTKMGIVWITLSIVGVVIILFAIKKRD